MPSTPVKIGPFSGGLNTYSDPSAVGDNECVDIKNFDIDLDGSIYSRPPILVKDINTDVPGAGVMKILGWFTYTDGELYMICSTPTTTYARQESNNTWITITGTFGATAFIQYANKAWLIASPLSANPGGSWVPNVFTAVAAMAKGASAIVYKERLFVAGGRDDVTNANRVFFSNAADFTTWNMSTNFFDVRSGDGQHVVRLQLFQDTVVIFKEDSTYAYSYDSAPARGAVRSINNVVGCGGVNCVVEYENSLYIYHDASVYQLSNWNFTLINLKVPFRQNIKFPTLTQDATVSLLFDRLVVRYFDSIYVFGLRTGTWTTWDVDSTRVFDYFVEVPTDDITDAREYVAGSRQSDAAEINRNIYRFTNQFTAGDSEPMSCSITTKAYDFNVPYTFKRMFWWGVDIFSKNDLSYVVHPSSYTRFVSHKMMSAYTHAEITGTFAQPLDVSIDVTDSLAIANSNSTRTFIKLLKSLRFRQINFTVSGTTDGTSLQGPLRIFGIVTFIDNKQLVSKQVS